MGIDLFPLATFENFAEADYLKANPDVAAAVLAGGFASGRQHFEIHGIHEGRRLGHVDSAEFREAKRRKLARVEVDLLLDMPHHRRESHFDFLTEELRAEFGIVDTSLVSSHPYDNDMMELVNESEWVLDCGAGSRPAYFDNVVNFEIVNYPSTDVIGVGETLPFRDNTFDAIISNSVLEHVKVPWVCASEILRVLKPGGTVFCCVPLLSPVHGYPHHYFNMTALGLRTLFGDAIEVIDQYVPKSTGPIWALTWIIQSWSSGLEGELREEFLDMTFRDLLRPAVSFLEADFVTQLSEAKNFELAEGTVLRFRKPID